MRRKPSLHRGFILALMVLSVNSYSYSSPSQRVKFLSQPLYSTESSSSYVDTFNDLGGGEIPQWLLERCEKLGYVSPTPVQEAALPAVFKGQDVILQAQTGSGKTLVYSIPVLSKIDAKRAAIQAVIVVPSRELGLQVAGILKQLANGSPDKIMIMSLMEGSKNRRQQLWATAEPPHIVVGNPRSIQKIVDVGRLRLNSVAFVVVDEVDACLISSETRQVSERKKRSQLIFLFVRENQKD
jgi:superfamily II DNA/RNA helicase